MRTKISVDAYEAAERDLILTGARKAWRRHALTFALALVATVLVEVRWGSVSWLVYFLLGAWAVGVGIHYRGWVLHGDARIRERQGQIEWRAGRSNEHLVPRR
jgi:hypothetical protein